MHHSPSPARRSAFSLLELLVVISIIGLIAVFVVPAATTMVMGTELTRASQQMSTLFATARQAAITKNHLIEVRLMKFRDPEAPGETSNPDTWPYRAVQLMEVLPNARPGAGGKLEQPLVAASKVERLTGSVVMNDKDFSSLLAPEAETDSGQKPPDLIDAVANDPALPRMAEKDARTYKYRRFRFLTDGSTNLSATGKWYVTLLSAADQRKVANTGGADAIFKVNYFTLQVDPVSGSTRAYRPTLASAAKK